MTIRSRMTGAALMLTLSMGALAACGGSDGGSDSTDEATAAPSSSAAPTSEAAPEADGKPSKEDVVDGYTKIITGQLGDNLPDDIVEKVVTCFVDEVYDDASADTLNAIADSKPEGVDPDDASLFTDASGTCTKEITGQ